jgi:methylthioribose-1-phosphate isomerase
MGRADLHYRSRHASGEHIPIERDRARSPTFWKVRIAPDGEKANPAFDVTPARYITAIITEKGAFKPRDIRKLGYKRPDFGSFMICGCD